MNEFFLEQYSRQIRLPQVGEQGQRRLSRSTVLIIGAGGLGSPVSMYLAAAGVGRLYISDFDRVDRSNLQRQIMHRVRDLGEPKAESALRTLMELNPDCRVETLDWVLDGDELDDYASKSDLILDCTDNFPTRFDINRASLKTGVPLVSAAAVRMEGQLASFHPGHAHSPCYRCLYRDESVEAATCAAEGVLAPVVGVLGSLQAMEALKMLIPIEPTLVGKLLLFDGGRMDFQTIRLPRDPNCPACAERTV